MIHKPSVAVIIDFWNQGLNRSVIYTLDPMLKFIRQNFIKCIVVASYAEWEYHKTQATPIEWPIWHSSRQMFNPDINPCVPDYVGRSWQSLEHAHASFQPPDQLQDQFVILDQPITEPMLLEELARISTPSFAAWEMNQLAYLLNEHYPEIENIYLCGGSFDQCLQNRPLGLAALEQALSRSVFKNIQRLLIPMQCVHTGKELLFSEDVQANPQLLNPGWTHLVDQQLLVVKNRPNRESTTSAAVQAAIQQPLPTVQPRAVDVEQLTALEAARLDSRRGLL
jgi:hypothetical protein